eukprot:jgi/Chrzof1/14048/Cz08g22160.t1
MLRQQGCRLLASSQPVLDAWYRTFAQLHRKGGSQWHVMVQQGHNINPCNSMLHPAVKEAGILPGEGEELSVQQAYDADSKCFGCGPAHDDGLGLHSKRIHNGLEAHISIPHKYRALPGIIHGGILSTLMDCHGNWTAAIALMDKACLPRPPLTLTASMLITYKEPIPPDTPIILRSQVVAITDGTPSGLAKSSVEVDVTIYQAQQDGMEKLLVTGTGIYKRHGALRAM